MTRPDITTPKAPPCPKCGLEQDRTPHGYRCIVCDNTHATRHQASVPARINLGRAA